MRFIADLHTHTCASTHAFSTVTENAAAAEKAGIKYLAVTDHGTAMPDSPHIWHFISMKHIPRKIGGVFILRGMEANILSANGNVDINKDEVFDALDWAVASFHFPVYPPDTKLSHTKAYIKALENPHVDCIGHPDSREYDFDFAEVCRAARELDKAIELNMSRFKGQEAIKRYRMILEACAAEGTKIAVNSDAHYCANVGAFSRAEAFLEEMGFPENLILNADEDRLRKHIISHKGDIFE